MSQDQSIDTIRQLLLSAPALFNRAGGINSNIHKLLSNEIKGLIQSWFPHLTLGRAIYCVVHGLSAQYCEVCSAPVTYFDSKSKQFSKHCSISCSRKSSKSKEKRAATKLQKYGHAGFNNREKNAQTCLEKYGVTNPVLSDDVKAKISSTLKNQYLIRGDEIKAQKNNTFFEKYGGHPARRSETEKKRISTNLKKYGTEYPHQRHLSTQQIEALSSKKWLQEQHESQKKSISVIALELNVSPEMVSRWLKKHQIPITYYYTSGPEQDVCAFLTSLGVKVEQNNRTLLSGREIDLYLPEHRLGIELNGLHWHSEQYGKTANYHSQKTDQCNEKGITLLHIWDSEWLDPVKKEIWKSLIRSKIGTQLTKIPARKTRFAEITATEARTFLEQNHLQGFLSGIGHYGLYYRDELVMVASFCKSRFSKTVRIELARLASKIGVTVVGGASKIFAHQPHALFISYANRRYSNGNVYTKTGFSYIGTTKPNYWYLIGNKLQSRIQFQKHKLSKKLKIFDPVLTEAENMLANGFYRVWDCGNLTFLYSRPQ